MSVQVVVKSCTEKFCKGVDRLTDTIVTAVSKSKKQTLPYSILRNIILSETIDNNTYTRLFTYLYSARGHEFPGEREECVSSLQPLCAGSIRVYKQTSEEWLWKSGHFKLVCVCVWKFRSWRVTIMLYLPQGKDEGNVNMLIHRNIYSSERWKKY